MIRMLALLFAVVLVAPALADQEKIPNYKSARDTHFYKKLYKHGGRTLYCNERFTTKSGLNVEHVYPASWMKDTADCSGRSRQQCRDESPRFNRMEADLHNLYPALAGINGDRSNYDFAIIGADVNEPDYGACDFEIDAAERLAEPRPAARGEIARAMFYMHKEYGLPLSPSQFELLRGWHEADEVSAEEVRRNNEIFDIQETRNLYIDHPDQVSELAAAMFGSASGDDSWEECRIKGNISRSGKIYHLPGMSHYSRTKIDEGKGEKWFCSEAEAQAAGWRKSSQ